MSPAICMVDVHSRSGQWALSLNWMRDHWLGWGLLCRLLGMALDNGRDAETKQWWELCFVSSVKPAGSSRPPLLAHVIVITGEC